jgi:hypothetical protein
MPHLAAMRNPAHPGKRPADLNESRLISKLRAAHVCCNCEIGAAPQQNKETACKVRRVPLQCAAHCSPLTLSRPGRASLIEQGDHAARRARSAHARGREEGNREEELC